MTLPVSVKALCYNALTVFHAPPPNSHPSKWRPPIIPPIETILQLFAEIVVVCFFVHEKSCRSRKCVCRSVGSLFYCQAHNAFIKRNVFVTQIKFESFSVATRMKPLSFSDYGRWQMGSRRPSHQCHVDAEPAKCKSTWASFGLQWVLIVNDIKSV